MKRDLRNDRRRHSALQLEMAALAVRAGFSAALEDRSGGQGAPSDVLLRRGPHAVRVETFAFIPDKRFREERAYWVRVMAGIRSIDWQYDVSVAGDLGDHPGDVEVAELLQRIAAAAQVVHRRELRAQPAHRRRGPGDRAEAAATPAQVALAWLLAKDDDIAPFPVPSAPPGSRRTWAPTPSSSPQARSQGSTTFPWPSATITTKPNAPARTLARRALERRGPGP